MGFQFVHMESFSRKADSKGRGTSFIFAEARRDPAASVHVANPAPPTVVYGLDIAEVEALHDAAADAARTTPKSGPPRRLRQDHKTLHTVIASHPHTMDEVRADPDKRAEVEVWEKRTIEWLRLQYGNDLKSVVRHEDESHFHLHAYVIPADDPEMRALRHHPGATAKRAVMASAADDGENVKALHKRADAAYKGAMRQWQDSYHADVGIPCGLARLGPKKRRLTRSEWQAEKVQAKALQATVEQAKQVKRSGNEFISRTKSEAATIRSAAMQEKETAAKATAAAKHEKAAAEKARAAAIAERDRAKIQQEQAQATIENAQRYAGWAARLRAVWDSLRKSRIMERIRSEFSVELDRAQKKTMQTQRQLDAERKQRKLAEMAAQQARQAAATASLQRDQARSILKRYQDEPEAAPSLSAVPTLQLQLKPKFNDKLQKDTRA